MSQQLTFVIVNESKSAPLAAQVTSAFLAAVAVAVTIQLNRDFAPEWGGSYAVRVGSSGADVLKGEIVFAIVDSLPDAPGAIAFHDVDGSSVPVAFLGLSTCNSLDDVSTAISHECVETAADAECNVWADSGAGGEVAREAADAVESTTYIINAVAVSDFLLQSFFAPCGQAPYSFVQSMGGSGPSAPFQTAPGGYQIVRDAGANERQVTAEHASHHHAKARLVGAIQATHKQAKARHWSSRVYRRGVRLAA